MKKIICLFAFVLFAVGIQAQDVTTNYGCSMTYNETSGKYDVTLTGVSQKKSVDLLVDQIQARSDTPQQVGGYIIEYDNKTYTVSLDENIQGREGFPATFTSVSDARTYIKKDLKFALDNL